MPECADKHSIMEVPRRRMAGKTVIDCAHGGMRQLVTTGCSCGSSSRTVARNAQGSENVDVRWSRPRPRTAFVDRERR